MSLLMLAVVALFPVVLLAILLLTSGLEGRFVSSERARRLASQGPPRPRSAGQRGVRSAARHD
jgi:hypothetical protein